MIAVITFIIIALGMFFAQWDEGDSLKDVYDKFSFEFRQKETLIAVSIFVVIGILFDIICGI